FYQQGVAQDAGVVHQAVDATEILHDLVEGGDHLIFFSNVADIGAGVATGLLAQLHGFVELLLAQVDQSQLGTLAGQKGCHATAQTLSAAGDGDHCIFKIHTDPSLRLTRVGKPGVVQGFRSEEHTSELQSRENLVCRLLLEKKNKLTTTITLP